MPRRLRVLQITDTHLCADEHAELGGVNTEWACRQVIDLLVAEDLPADLLLVTGDIVHDSSAAAYLRLRRRLEQLRVPTLVIPGNHDQPTLMRDIFSSGAVRWQGHDVVGNWLVVMLDSTIPQQPGGHLSEAELERLEALLFRYPDHYALVCLHHHPQPMGSEWIDKIGVDNGEALFELLQRHPQARAVLWGHVHQAYDAYRGHLRLLASPSTCLQFTPKLPRFCVDVEAPGYRLLELDEQGGLETSVRRLKELPQSLNMQLSGY